MSDRPTGKPEANGYGPPNMPRSGTNTSHLNHNPSLSSATTDLSTPTPTAPRSWGRANIPDGPSHQGAHPPHTNNATLQSLLDPSAGSRQIPPHAPASRLTPAVPLPRGWEERVTNNGRRYWIDHINRTSTWSDPRHANFSPSYDTTPEVVPRPTPTPRLPTFHTDTASPNAPPARPSSTPPLSSGSRFLDPTTAAHAGPPLPSSTQPYVPQQQQGSLRQLVRLMIQRAADDGLATPRRHADLASTRASPSTPLFPNRPIPWRDQHVIFSREHRVRGESAHILFILDVLHRRLHSEDYRWLPELLQRLTGASFIAYLGITSLIARPLAQHINARTGVRGVDLPDSDFANQYHAVVGDRYTHERPPPAGPRPENYTPVYELSQDIRDWIESHILERFPILRPRPGETKDNHWNWPVGTLHMPEERPANGLTTMYDLLDALPTISPPSTSATAAPSSEQACLKRERTTTDGSVEAPDKKKQKEDGSSDAEEDKEGKETEEEYEDDH